MQYVTYLFDTRHTLNKFHSVRNPFALHVRTLTWNNRIRLKIYKQHSYSFIFSLRSCVCSRSVESCESAKHAERSGMAQLVPKPVQFHTLNAPVSAFVFASVCVYVCVHVRLCSLCCGRFHFQQVCFCCCARSDNIINVMRSWEAERKSERVRAQAQALRLRLSLLSAHAFCWGSITKKY